jgi:hypothetical protein
MHLAAVAKKKKHFHPISLTQSLPGKSLVAATKRLLGTMIPPRAVTAVRDLQTCRELVVEAGS